MTLRQRDQARIENALRAAVQEHKSVAAYTTDYSVRDARNFEAAALEELRIRIKRATRIEVTP